VTIFTKESTVNFNKFFVTTCKIYHDYFSFDATLGYVIFSMIFYKVRLENHPTLFLGHRLVQ